MTHEITSLFWDVTQRRLVYSYRSFETTYRSLYKGPLAFENGIYKVILKGWQLIANLGCITSQKSEDLFYTGSETWSHIQWQMYLMFRHVSFLHTTGKKRMVQSNEFTGLFFCAFCSYNSPGDCSTTVAVVLNKPNSATCATKKDATSSQSCRLTLSDSKHDMINHVCTAHQWRLKHFIIQQMHKNIILRYN